MAAQLTADGCAIVRTTCAILHGNGDPALRARPRTPLAPLMLFSPSMKFAALALDYDGTTAEHDELDPQVRRAVGEARERGIAVLLVTGRRLDDLHRVAGDLSCFDAVVAENGAVLEFPESGRHVAASHRPARVFLDELRLRGVEFSLGETVLETDASAAAETLAALRKTEQPLILAFNRGRLMVLPQAIGKSTGLRQALQALRLSVHNTVGIGDAENDHDLLDACEVGVAVEWGSPALRAVADEVIAGAGPPAVAAYIRGLLRQPRLSPRQMGRRRLQLGKRYSGEPVSLAVRGRTILIAGEPGTGKSWLAGLLCEQLILQGYAMCVIDPEGDYRSLEALPGVVVLGGDDPPPHARELVRSLRHPDISTVVDLSKMTHAEKLEYVTTLLPLLMKMRRRTGLPHKILVDEAHYYLGAPESHLLIDPELAGYILVTYDISTLHPAIRETEDAVVFVTRETDPEESDALLALCRPRPCKAANPQVFGELGLSEAALLPGAEEAHGTIQRFTLGPRLTTHVRHQAKYLDMPVLEPQAFVFTDHGEPGPRARTLKEFMGLLAVLPETVLAEHLARHDFSRWIGDVFRDHSLGNRVKAIEDRSHVEKTRSLAADLSRSIRARYDLADPTQSFLPEVNSIAPTEISGGGRGHAA